MDEETRRAFQAVISQSATRDRAAAEARQLREDTATTFATDFARTLREVIVPEFNQITPMLTAGGWMCESHEEADHLGLEFHIYKGNMAGAGGRRRPNIQFKGNPTTQKVLVGSSTPLMSDGGKWYLLSEITGDFVSAQVLAFFQRLAQERQHS
jgi:hypothetical protein